jgi:nucleotide-binding universal stress UspA family protein
MFQKILVPLDLTNRHQPALQIATDFARQSKGEITLLHVIEIIPGLSMEEEKTFYGRLERMARSHLDRFGGSLNAENIPWRAEVRFGNRAPGITHFAAEIGADLIILTSPVLDPANPAPGWGSLSYKVGILARCPVLLVK